MHQTVTVHYPNPTDFENAILFMNVCAMGDYVTAGNSRVVEMPITYEVAKNLSAQILRMDSLETTMVSMDHANGTLRMDANLALEVYAALVEIIVDVEIGEDLAMIEVEEQPLYAMN